MSDVKHTAGPWRVVDDEGDNLLITAPSRDGKVEICAVQIGFTGPVEAEQHANARLIAAAPDLLEACKRAEQFIQNGRDLGFIRMPDASTPDSAHHTPSIIAAAIAKAVQS